MSISLSISSTEPFLEKASGVGGEHLLRNTDKIHSPGRLNSILGKKIAQKNKDFLLLACKDTLHDMLFLLPLGQESLFHRSIMDLGFCNVILVKEENTRYA